MKILKSLVPTETILACQVCRQVWVQTLGYALCNPTEIAACPACKSPYTTAGSVEVDTPTIVEGTKCE